MISPNVGTASKPNLIQGNLAELPGALLPLTEIDQWATWCIGSVAENGHFGKVPYRPGLPGTKANVKFPEQWATYDEALKAYQNGAADEEALRTFPEGKPDGIGFLLAGTDIAAFDIDNCVDPATGIIAPFAKALVAVARSYAELTVSGTGIRIIGRGSFTEHKIQEVPGHHPVVVESYCNANRFIVVTGNPLPGSPTVLRDIETDMRRLVKLLSQKRPIDCSLLADLMWEVDVEEAIDTIVVSQAANRPKAPLPVEVVELIDKGPPSGCDRSKRVFWAVCRMYELGWTKDEIEARLRGRPLADRYEEKRSEGKRALNEPDVLATDISRIWDKALAKDVCQQAASPSVVPSVDNALGEGDGESVSGQSGDGQRAKIAATPFLWTNPAEIPPREWLYGRFLVRGFVSLTVAPSGVGKSSLTIVEALAMASGRKLLHDEPTGRLKVWMWNGEDPRHELSRRIAAAALEHEVVPSQIGDRLFVDTGHETEIVFSELTTHAAMDSSPSVAAVREEIIRRQIDVVVIDPFIASHGASENDNMAIDRIAKTWARIAEKARCAIHLVHHTRKLGGFDADIEHSRGAGALIAATRAARTLNVMSRREANAAGIENHRSIVRLEDGNPNLAPPAKYPQWLQLKTVPLPNGRDGAPGDEIGVIKRADLDDPALLAALPPLSEEAVRKVVQAVSAGKLRSNSQAQAWVGQVIGPAFDLDPGTPGARTKSPDKAKISRIQRALFDDGYIKYVKEKNGKSKFEEWVLVGSRGETLLSPEPTGEEGSDV